MSIRLNHKQISMTEGNIFRILLQYCFPLLVGNFFQQLYNTVDAWVVGNYLSNEAYSAIGSVVPAINALISMFLGLSTGVTVVTSQYFGANNREGVRQTVHTAMLATVYLGVFLSIIGIILIPPMLTWMNVPDEVAPNARVYLIVIFGGLIGSLVYNMGAGILRAVGDSMTPFVYLVITTFLNAVLDLLFVIVLKLGILGVALATIITQILSAILVLLSLCKNKGCISLKLNELKIHNAILRQVVKIGIPTSIEMTVMSISNMFAFSYINAFGTDFMSGWTSYERIDQVIQLPLQTLTIATQTFVGQCLGNRDIMRAKAGTRCSLIMGACITVVLICTVLVFAPILVSLFNDKPIVVAYGTSILYWITPYFVLNVISRIINGAVRGAGKSYQPTIINLVTVVLCRQIYLFFVSKEFVNNYIVVILAFPLGWLLYSIVMFLYYKRMNYSEAIKGI